MQNIEQIKMLNLTEDDFKLLIDGLDALPEKGVAGEMVGELFMSILEDKTNAEGMAKLKAEREKRRIDAESKKQQMKEDVKILQGKLLMLKRYLQENNALAQAYEVLNIPK